MRAVGVVLILAAAVAVAGCASATKVEAPKGPDHALLSSILGGMKTDLVSVRIEEPTKEWGGPTARHLKLGLSVSAISFERPYGLAPIVTVTSSRPQRATTAFYRSSPFLRLPIEGFLVRMVDGIGRTFLIDGSSLRTKEGSGWTRPGLQVPNSMEVGTP